MLLLDLSLSLVGHGRADLVVVLVELADALLLLSPRRQLSLLSWRLCYGLVRLGEDVRHLLDVWNVDRAVRDEEGRVVERSGRASDRLEERGLLLVGVHLALLTRLVAVTDAHVADASGIGVEDVRVSRFLVLASIFADGPCDWRNV